MKIARNSIYALLAVAPALVTALVNKQVMRTVHLTSTVPRELISITVENDTPMSANEYSVWIGKDAKIAWLQAADPASDVMLPMNQKQEIGDYIEYSVELNTPLKPKESRRLDLRMSLIHSLKPYPPRIPQSSSQKLQYSTPLRMSSPYSTTSESLVVMLPSDQVEQFTEIAPVARKGNQITYGPFDDKKENEMVQVLYVHNRPLITAVRQRREIEVSHWGANLAIEEHYLIRHDGAKLEKEFSRLEFTKNSHLLPQTPVYWTMRFNLPTSANGVYYRDLIGNVSTSNLRYDQSEAVLDLHPRFPMYGSWKYDFYYGYNQPLEQVLRINANNRYVLKVPLIDSGRDWERDDVQVRILLPEGAVVTDLWMPVQGATVRFGRWRTYIDVKGRTAIWLNIRNLVDEHAQNLLIEYEYSTAALMQKPYTLATAFLIVFIGAIVWSRIDLSIPRK